MEINRCGSQPSGKGLEEYFTGTVRIDSLFEVNEPARSRGASVTFEPCARTAWHTHPLGQTLIVTSGIGRVQRWGGPIEEIRPGDVVSIAPEEKHWHGASPTVAMTHIAIQEALNGKVVERMEEVATTITRGEPHLRISGSRQRWRGVGQCRSMGLCIPAAGRPGGRLCFRINKCLDGLRVSKISGRAKRTIAARLRCPSPQPKATTPSQVCCASGSGKIANDLDIGSWDARRRITWACRVVGTRTGRESPCERDNPGNHPLHSRPFLG